MSSSLPTLPLLQRPSRALIARALAAIPTHRHPPLTLAAILRELAAQPNRAHADDLQIALSAALALLDAFSGLSWCETADGPAVQTRSQLDTYFARSAQLTLAANGEWHMTPELLRLLEQQRVTSATQIGTPAAPTRTQRAVFLLIVRQVQTETQLLHQFDTAARQYQLIGGRLEPGETAEDAAWREFQEEVGISQTMPLRAEEGVLQPVLESPFELENFSATYGAFTHYTFSAYHLRLARPTLQQGSLDRWISPREMLIGHTDDGQSLGALDIARALDTRLPGGLAALPTSFVN